MPAVNFYYAESLGESSASLTATTILTLAYTPPANTKYFVWTTGEYTNSVSTAAHNVVLNANSLWNTVRVHNAASPQDYIPYAGFRQYTYGASPTEQSYTLDLNSSSTGDIAKAKNNRMVALEAGPNDRYVESFAAQQTNSTAYIVDCQIVFVPQTTGRHLLFGCSQIAALATSGGVVTRINAGGYGTFGGSAWKTYEAWNEVGGPLMAAVTLTTSVTITINLEFAAAVTGSMAQLEFAALAVIDLSRFDYSSYIYGSTTVSTTLLTDQSFLSLSITAPASNVAYLVLGKGEFFSALTTVSNYYNFQQDGTVVNEYVKEANIASTAVYTALAYVATLTSGQAHVFNWNARSESTGAPVSGDEMAIVVLQLGSSAVQLDVSCTGAGFVTSFGGAPPIICPAGF